MAARLNLTLPSWKNLLVWAMLRAQLAWAEWESILKEATLVQDTLDSAKSQGRNALIDGSFKTATVTDPS